MGADALSNGASAVILLLVAVSVREYWKREISS